MTLSINTETVDLDPVRNELRDAYDDWRTSLLNKLYYGCIIDKLARYNQIFEIVIAVGASGSGVAGFALWKSDVGKPVWGVIAGLSILLSAIKPAINITSKLDEYSKIYTEYSVSEAIYRQISRTVRRNKKKIKESGDLPSSVGDALKKNAEKFQELAPKGIKKPDTKLVNRLVEVVNQQIPTRILWIP